MSELTNITNLSLVEYSAAIIVVNIILAFCLSFIISMVYRRTHRGISYSQSFVLSLIMISVLSAMAMMILGNNLIRALGILGVFTLLRFRTIIKDTRDATFLFFALAIGMAVGTNNYTIAGIGTVMLSAIILFLHRINFGSVVREGFMLTFVTKENFKEDMSLGVFKDYLGSFKLLQIKTQADNEQEYYYSVRFVSDEKRGEFLKKIQGLEGVVYADLVSSRDAAEY